MLHIEERVNQSYPYDTGLLMLELWFWNDAISTFGDLLKRGPCLISVALAIEAFYPREKMTSHSCHRRSGSLCPCGPTVQYG